MNSFLDRLRGRDKPTKASTGGPWLTAYAQGGINLSAWGTDYQSRAEKYLAAYGVGWFYKAGSRISQDFAQLSATLAYEDSAGDNAEEIVAPASNVPWRSLDPLEQFLRLWERPNAYQTGRAFRQRCQIHLDFAGRSLVYLENGEGTGLPTAMYGISPHRMWPSVNAQGILVGWVMDKNAPSGGTPFSADEIMVIEYPGVGDQPGADPMGVVQAVYSQVPLTAQMAQHTSDVLATGGRLAGMIWPKDRALSEDEYQDAQRAYRNVTSDPNAARRLLVFPEPMEYSGAAASPQELALPELAALTQEEILTSFPIHPFMVGVPLAAGLNSGDSLRYVKSEYWEGTQHPRVEVWEDAVQFQLMPRYEKVIGRPLDFDIEEPNLDDAASLTAKVEAFKGLVSVGFEPKEAVAAVALDHIKWLALPALIDPAKQAEAAAAATEALAQRPMMDNQPPPDAPKPPPTNLNKGLKGRREDTIGTELPGFQASMQTFLADQQARLADEITRVIGPLTKSQRKALPDDWWDQKREDEYLREHLRGLYVRLSRTALTVVANDTDRLVLPERIQRVTEKMLTAAATRITGINQTTRDAVAEQVSEGVRRGYSIQQIVSGVTDEGYKGVRGASAFDEARAELVARTETMLAYNESALRGYDEFGVAQVEAIDGDGDPECAERDGRVFSIEDALAVDEHPNGTLDWAPISDGKAVSLAYLDAIKAVAERPQAPLNLTVNASPVTVNTPEQHITVDVPEQPAPVVQNTVNVPEAPAPLVMNTVNVPETTVNVAVPEQPAPLVVNNVTVPDQAAPIVNVAAPVVNTPITVQPAEVKAADVVVNVDSVRVVEMPDRVHRVIRDTSGKPTGSVESDITE